jgi:uncharacterized protein YpuA (DUF1002 family)
VVVVAAVVGAVAAGATVVVVASAVVVEVATVVTGEDVDELQLAITIAATTATARKPDRDIVAPTSGRWVRG